MANPTPLYVFLVSGRPEGAAPGGSHGTDNAFAICAWLRVVELVNKFFDARKAADSVVQTSPVVRFIHFASHDSTVGIYEHDFATMKNVVKDSRARSVATNWKLLDETFTTAFGTLTTQQNPKEFVEWRQVRDAKAANPATWGPDDPASPNVSIVNVYHSVRKAPRASVLELSIFGHAFVDGPVLNNTDAPPAGSTTRLATDTDGRADLDFLPNMGESGTANANALQEFKGAFAANGSFRIWGCNVQDIVVTVPPEGGTARRCLIRSTVLEVEDALHKQLLRRGTLNSFLVKLPAGSTNFTLDMDEQIGNELSAQTDRDAGGGLTPFPRNRLFEIRYDEKFTNHSYNDFFKGQRTTAGAFTTSITRSLSDIAKFVAAETATSYFFKAANALQTVDVISGAPGTSADVPNNGQQFIGPGRTAQAVFFQKFFGASLTEPGAAVQRHFSILDNQGNAVKKILDCKANGLP
jgi:hypothetical protein